MINNNIIGPKNYLGIKEEDAEKAMQLLQEGNVEFNHYENSHSVISHEEAISTCDRMVNDGAEYGIEVSYENNGDELKELENELYQKLYDTNRLECGIYDNEFIYEVEQESINKFVEMILNKRVE